MLCALDSFSPRNPVDPSRKGVYEVFYRDAHAAPLYSDPTLCCGGGGREVQLIAFCYISHGSIPCSELKAPVMGVSLNI